MSSGSRSGRRSFERLPRLRRERVDHLDQCRKIVAPDDPFPTVTGQKIDEVGEKGALPVCGAGIAVVDPAPQVAADGVYPFAIALRCRHLVESGTEICFRIGRGESLCCPAVDEFLTGAVVMAAGGDLSETFEIGEAFADRGPSLPSLPAGAGRIARQAGAKMVGLVDTLLGIPDIDLGGCLAIDTAKVKSLG
jgi:hypothetical protein